MALFPAYSDYTEDVEEEVLIGTSQKITSEQSDICIGGAGTAADEGCALEVELLASEASSEEEVEPPCKLARTTHEPEHFYVDKKLDCGNLWVSTLYYPGRPQYDVTRRHGVVGGTPRDGGGRRAGRRRYFEAPPPPSPGARDADEGAARAAALRRALAAAPRDEALWMRYIHVQDRWGARGAAQRACEEAARALPAARRVRGALHAARLASLAPRDLAALLRDELAAEKSPALKLEMWCRLLNVVCDGGEGGVRAAAAAALRQLRHHPPAYPQILYIYGSYLSAAGLWEQLVLLLELVAAMNYPRAGFPQDADSQDDDSRDGDLQAAEDELIGSGLPLSTVWARAERARAAAHWRPVAVAACGGDPQRAPQPPDVADLLLPAPDADSAFLLSVRMLMLAKVPLMPCAEYVQRAVGAGGGAEEEWGGAAGALGGEALLPLLRAARRLPPAHPSHPAPPCAARRLVALLLDPPHYLGGAGAGAGFSQWVTALWDASCAWAEGERREALLCWRLRWLHSLLLLLDSEGRAVSVCEVYGAQGRQDDEGAAELFALDLHNNIFSTCSRCEVERAEARRLRATARAALKRFGGDSPLPYAIFARLEQAAAAGAKGAKGPDARGPDAKGPDRARAAAAHALRAALADSDCPVTHRLFAARVMGEVYAAGGGGPGRWAAGRWAACCAVLGRTLPTDDAVLARGPDAALLDLAHRQCEERCAQLEAQWAVGAVGAAGAMGGAEGGTGAAACAALRPGAGEWAAARVALAPPTRLHELARLAAEGASPASPASPAHEGNLEAMRYYEQAACACACAMAGAGAGAGGGRAARSLAPLFPYNGLLALVSGGAPLWERAWAGEGAWGAAGGARSHAGALAHALPALLRAARNEWAPHEAERARRAVARACGAAGGGVGCAARLEAEARAPRPRPDAALLAALDRHPDHKWLYVRGAQWSAREGGALPDALLARGLRLHVLPDELCPPRAPL